MNVATAFRGERRDRLSFMTPFMEITLRDELEQDLLDLPPRSRGNRT